MIDGRLHAGRMNQDQVIASRHERPDPRPRLITIRSVVTIRGAASPWRTICLEMRGLKRLASARTIFAGHAFVQNLRRGHYAITRDLPVQDRVRAAFEELALFL
jgi:hypothetical protein